MKILLARDWYAPGDNYYRRLNNPHEVGDEQLPHLPSGAQIIQENGKPLSKSETRKLVLKDRHEKKLDLPSAQLPKNEDELFDDDAYVDSLDAPAAKPAEVDETDDDEHKA